MNRIWQEVKSAMTPSPMTSKEMKGQGNFLMLAGVGWFILTCFAARNPTFYESFVGAKLDHQMPLLCCGRP